MVNSAELVSPKAARIPRGIEKITEISKLNSVAMINENAGMGKK